MNLTHISIRNFRSVADLKIELTPTCRVLVGINEGGKTNILRALSMLSKDVAPIPADCREPLPEEGELDEFFVKFHFSMSESDIKEVEKIVSADFLTTNIRQVILTDSSRKKLTLLDLCRHIGHAPEYNVDVQTADKTVLCGSIDDSSIVMDNLYKPSDECPPDFKVGDDDEESSFSECSIVDVSDYPEIPGQHLTKLTTYDVWAIIAVAVEEYVEQALPTTFLWEYTEANLLPGTIDLEGFKSDPDSCLPLKYMFELGGVAEIAKDITYAQTRPNGLRNLLKRVAANSTAHIHSVWKDYKAIRIDLTLNGPNIEAGIQDQFNFYNFERRSYGFKRFITFLLMISVRERTKSLQNALLLIDEPGIGLHPSGERNLMDELIKISVTNKVVYSTHSIFMVDRDIVGRHLIVKKQKECTFIEQVAESNVMDEEIIFNALNYSVFEHLRKRNIVFEGWRDKRLFKVALSRIPSSASEARETRNKLKDIGTCHAQGVKHVQYVASMLELGRRECLIVSDNDEVAKQHQRNYRGYGKWLRYEDIVPDELVVTGEDFVKSSAFTPIIKTLRGEFPDLTELDENRLESNRGKLYALRGWMLEGGLSEQSIKIQLERIKERVFDDLKSSHIEPRYYDLIKGLAELI